MSPTTLRLNTFESPPSGVLPPDRERAIRHLLESVVRESAAGRRQRGRMRLPDRWPGRSFFRLGLATAVTAVLLAVSLVVAHVLRPDAQVVHAATPTMTGHEMTDGEPAAGVLQDLAVRTASAPDATGAENTIRTERWSLAVTVQGGAPDEGAADEGAASDAGAPGEGAAGEGPARDGAAGAGTASDAGTEVVTTAVIPVLRDLTRHTDGSVTIREVGGEAQFPNEAYREAWNDDGQPGPDGEVLRDETLPAASYPDIYPEELPSSPESLRDVLSRDRPAAASDPGELLHAVHDLRYERALDGVVRAAVLEMLADAEVESLGETTDRAGRAALAIGAASDESGWPIRHILLLDPEDGRIIGYEQVLTSDVDRVDVAAPAIIDYTLFR